MSVVLDHKVNPAIYAWNIAAIKRAVDVFVPVIAVRDIIRAYVGQHILLGPTTLSGRICVQPLPERASHMEDYNTYQDISRQLNPISTHITLPFRGACKQILFWFPHYEDGLKDCKLLVDGQVHTSYTNNQARYVDKITWGVKIPTAPVYSITFAALDSKSGIYFSTNPRRFDSRYILRVATNRPIPQIHIVAVTVKSLNYCHNMCFST